MKYYRLLFVVLAASACLQSGDIPNTDATPLRLTFLHTADIHSRLLPYDITPALTDTSLGLLRENGPFGGAARLAYLIKRERSRSQRVLHLDSGDCFEGAPIYNLFQGEVEMRFMSYLQPDAVVIGNHEFDSGVTNYVNQLSKWASFPVLAANYVFPDWRDPHNNQLGKYAAPYEVFNTDGITIGVIGMANLSSLNSIGEGGNSLQIMPLEQNEILRHYVSLLRPNVDLLVVVSHLGLPEDPNLVTGYEHVVRTDLIEPNWTKLEDLSNGNSRVFIPGVDGVDVIFGGHLHVVLNPPREVKQADGRTTLIVHSGAFAKYLGRLDVVVDNDATAPAGTRRKKILSHKYQVFPVDNRLAHLEDANVVKLMQPYTLQLANRVDLTRYVGYAPQIIKRSAAGQSGDAALGNLVADSMRVRRRVEAEFALTNSLGIRDDIYPGPVTLEEMFNVFPFENTITVVYMSGYDVQDLFDFATERGASRACKPQAQIAGVRYIQNCAQVLANQQQGASFVHPAQDITINGAPLSLTQTYKVAVNNYIAAGGSGFDVLKRNTQKFDTGIDIRDGLVDYMRSFPSCANYEQANGICKLTDNASQALCADLQKYGDLPCIAAKQDGRIQLQLVLGKDQGQVNGSSAGGGSTNGDPTGSSAR